MKITITKTQKNPSGYVVDGTEGAAYRYIRYAEIGGEKFTTDSVSISESWNGYPSPQRPRGSKITNGVVKCTCFSTSKADPKIYLINGYILNDPSRFTRDGWDVEFTEEEILALMDEGRRKQIVPRGSSLERLFWNLHFS